MSPNTPQSFDTTKVMTFIEFPPYSHDFNHIKDVRGHVKTEKKKSIYSDSSIFSVHVFSLKVN